MVRYFVTTQGRTVSVEVRETVAGAPGSYVVRTEGKVFQVDVEAGHLLVDGRVVPCVIDDATGQVHLREGSAPCAVSTTDPAVARASAATHKPELRAPMPGKLVELRVAEGAIVARGECVAVIEAMKMQNELGAPVAAKVTRVHVSVGQAVEPSTLLVEFEPLPEGGSEGGPESAPPSA